MYCFFVSAKRRPYSVHTTKSAPDVIVTHWRSPKACEWEPYKRRHPRQFLWTTKKPVEQITTVGSVLKSEMKVAASVVEMTTILLDSQTEGTQTYDNDFYTAWK